MIAGQPSTDLEYLRDMDERLRAVERRRPTIELPDTPDVSPGAWNPVPPGTNWTSNSAAQDARMRKDSTGTVHLDGAMRNLAAFAFGGANLVFAVLPAEFRPSQVQVLAHVDVDPVNGPRTVAYQINATDGFCTVLNAGSAGVTGNIASVLYLSGISFLALDADL